MTSCTPDRPRAARPRPGWVGNSEFAVRGVVGLADAEDVERDVQTDGFEGAAPGDVPAGVVGELAENGTTDVVESTCPVSLFGCLPGADAPETRCLKGLTTISARTTPVPRRPQNPALASWRRRPMSRRTGRKAR